MGMANEKKVCLMLILLLAAFVLNSCGTGKANANPARRAETFFIQENTFVLRSDSDAEITVGDTATVYKLQSPATVFFTVLGDTISRSIALVANDLVIERPGVQAVTLVREAL
jgi:hypothetical protein